MKNGTGGTGGWVTTTVAVGANPDDFGGADSTALANSGHTTICRINYLSPQDHASCFRKVYNAIKPIRPNDKVMPQALAPWGGPYGATDNPNGSGHPADGMPLNWVTYLNQILTAIAASGSLDGIPLHIGSRGYTHADIYSTNQINAGGQNLYWSFYVYKDWINYGIPPSLYSLPLYVTECNGLYFWTGLGPSGEPNPGPYQAGWMQEIFAEFNRYNQSAATNGRPLFHCVNFCRWCAYCDGWNIDADASHPNPYKAQILSDLDASIAQLYRWPTNVVSTNPPAAPIGLTAAVGNGKITLNWTAPAFATTYRVKRSTTNGGPYSVIASNVAITAYSDLSFTPGTTYYYRVSALNNVGESPNSLQVSATPTNALPDVVVTGISWSLANPAPGNNVVFSARVLNQGSGATLNGVTLGVGFSVNGTQVSWSGGYHSALAPGASITLTADGGPNSGLNYWTATPGNHAITANVDDINRFNEADEGNNVSSTNLLIYASGYAINSGGSAAGSFAADNYWTGSANTYSVTNAIDSSGVTSPAPQAVYQTERWGNSTYAFNGLVPGTSYNVRLHWAEISRSLTGAGGCQFTVTLSGAQVLTNFDIYAAAGAKFRAVTRQFTAAANGSGQIILQFTQGNANEAKIGGIEITPVPQLAPVLEPIASQTIAEGSTLSFVALASDPQPG